MAVPCFPWSEAAPRSPQTSACATSASKRHQAPPLGGARLRPLAPRRGSFVPLRRAHLEQSFLTRSSAAPRHDDDDVCMCAATCPAVLWRCPAPVPVPVAVPRAGGAGVPVPVPRAGAGVPPVLVPRHPPSRAHASALPACTERPPPSRRVRAARCYLLSARLPLPASVYRHQVSASASKRQQASTSTSKRQQALASVSKHQQAPASASKCHQAPPTSLCLPPPAGSRGRSVGRLPRLCNNPDDSSQWRPCED